MNQPSESQRSGLNRRPLGELKAPFRRIFRRCHTLGARNWRVKRALSGKSAPETVPKPFLGALLTFALAAGAARRGA